MSPRRRGEQWSILEYNIECWEIKGNNKSNKQTWVIENNISFQLLDLISKVILHQCLKNCHFVMSKTQLLFYNELFHLGICWFGRKCYTMYKMLLLYDHYNYVHIMISYDTVCTSITFCRTLRWQFMADKTYREHHLASLPTRGQTEWHSKSDSLTWTRPVQVVIDTIYNT